MSMFEPVDLYLFEKRNKYFMQGCTRLVTPNKVKQHFVSYIRCFEAAICDNCGLKH